MAQCGLDLGGRQVEVEAGAVIWRKGAKAEAFPPGAGAVVEGADDNGATCRLPIEIDGCGEDVSRQRGADPETGHGPVDGLSADAPTLLVFPHTTTRRPGGMSRIGKIRKGPFLILPMCTTPPGGSRGLGGRGARSPPVRRARRATSAFSPLVDPEGERATGRKRMVARGRIR